MAMGKEGVADLFGDFKFWLRAGRDVWKICQKRDDEVREVAELERVRVSGKPKESWNEKLVHIGV